MLHLPTVLMSSSFMTSPSTIQESLPDFFTSEILISTISLHPTQPPASSDSPFFFFFNFLAPATHSLQTETPGPDL